MPRVAPESAFYAVFFFFKSLIWTPTATGKKSWINVVYETQDPSSHPRVIPSIDHCSCGEKSIFLFLLQYPRLRSNCLAFSSIRKESHIPQDQVGWVKDGRGAGRPGGHGTPQQWAAFELMHMMPFGKLGSVLLHFSLNAFLLRDSGEEIVI